MLEIWIKNRTTVQNTVALSSFTENKKTRRILPEQSGAEKFLEVITLDETNQNILILSSH